jgi:colanic acid biosynthesis glycosyl transferase WcaI
MTTHHLAILSPHYEPETGAAARRTTSLARFAASRGWRVSVITAQPHHPLNRVYDGFQGITATEVDEAGVEVTRIRPWLPRNQSLSLRLASESLFCVRALRHLVRARPSVVLASSPYMFLGPTGLLAARLRRTRFVWDVRDLTWLYPRAAGKRTFGVDGIIERTMVAVARRADGLTTATTGLLTYFRDRPALAIVAPNGVSDEWLDRLLSLELQDHANVGRPSVLYAGLLGYNHALETVIEAAQRLPHVRFTFAGDGSERHRLETMAESLGVSNATFVGHLDADALVGAYGAASILVSHVRAHPLFQWTQPAKLWEYLASGRPVVHAGEGEAVEILEQNDLALVVEPGQPDRLAAAIGRLIDKPSMAARLARNGREFVSRQRRRSLLLAEYLNLLEDVVESPK